MAIPVFYNFRSLLNRPTSSLASVVGIGLVVSIFIAALALANGFYVALSKNGSPNNVLILRKGADSEISSGIDREVANIVRALPDIAQGSDGKPLVSAEVVVLIAKERIDRAGSANVVVRGVEANAFTLRDKVKLAAGRFFTPGTDEVVVGQQMAQRFSDFALGHKIRLGQRDFTIVGHFSASGAGLESEIWGDAAVLMPVFRGEVFQSIIFRMRNPADFDAIKTHIGADPRLRVDVKRESDFYAAQSEMLTNLIRFAGVFITLIMTIGAIFGAMNTMYAAVGSRTREIGVLLTLGFTPGSLLLSFLFESIIISLVGGVLGMALALPINGITTSTTNFASFSEVGFAFQVNSEALLAGLILSALIGLMGGFFPARRAAKQSLATSLRAI